MIKTQLGDYAFMPPKLISFALGCRKKRKKEVLEKKKKEVLVKVSCIRIPALHTALFRSGVSAV